jgi:hypothetical protein
MGIATASLKPSKDVKNGKTQITITFTAVADTASENKVKLTLKLESPAPVYFWEGGVRKSTITWDDNFPLTAGTITKDVTIDADTTGVNLPNAYSLKLDAKSALGNDAAQINSHITLTN